jgi:hypothetical protein
MDRKLEKLPTSKKKHSRGEITQWVIILKDLINFALKRFNFRDFLWHGSWIGSISSRPYLSDDLLSVLNVECFL